MRNIEPSHDYGLGPSFTKEFSLVGKDKKKEKIRVMKKPSLFNKNFKVTSPKHFTHKFPTSFFVLLNFSTFFISNTDIFKKNEY